MRSRSRAFLALLSAAVIITIGTILFAAGPAPQGGGQVSASKPEVRHHMDEHFGKVNDVQAAVVRGDLEGAKEGARWIADHQETAGLPASGKGSLEEMRKAARTIADASDIKNAAEGTAKMAVACGACHAGSNARVSFPPPAKPAPKNRRVAHMLAHQHAVDLLYQGLIAPSDQAWAEGAKALQAAPLAAQYLPKPPKPSSEAAKAEEETHALADKAAAASNPAERASIYAQLVADCANCHAQYGKVLGPGVPK